MRKKSKRYYFNVVEEFIMNDNAKHFRGGRIEVFDIKAKLGYAVYEARWWLPIEIAQKFYDLFDGFETDHLPYLRFDYEKEKK
jgi:hypothetical protein